MAATKYQVMCRYINDTTNVAITNDYKATYEPVFEFYTDPDHRIFSSVTQNQSEELDRQQQIVASANLSSNPKNDMMFVYDGCEKVSHNVWVEDQTGYIVRNWADVRSKIGNKGDYSKEFTCLEHSTPEDGAIVVCTQAVFNKYYKPLNCIIGQFMTEADVQTMFDSSTIFSLKEPKWKDHATQGGCVSAYANGSHQIDYKILTGRIRIGDFEFQEYTYYVPRYYNSTYSGYWSWIRNTSIGIKDSDKNASNVYDSITHSANDVETTIIPGHYEISTKPPYCIRDKYKRVESSPWLVNSIAGSLEAALIKAKKLIEMIGMENVKIVKLVPVDQFIKVQ